GRLGGTFRDGLEDRRLGRRRGRREGVLHVADLSGEALGQLQAELDGTVDLTRRLRGEREVRGRALADLDRVTALVAQLSGQVAGAQDVEGQIRLALLLVRGDRIAGREVLLPDLEV